jgi:hypothetical protein
MHKLGISVYPERSTRELDDEYLLLAEKHGFQDLFTCLLSVQKGREETIREFTDFIYRAHTHGFSVAVDTNLDVFRRLGATAYDISAFAQMGADTIRLDGNLGDEGNIALTHNPYGITVQFNASSLIALDVLLERGANPHNMCVCHNFFPEPLTGLGEERFVEFTRRYHKLGLRVAAFVSSQQPDTFGPWEVYRGLPTCEADRTRPIDLQMRHLIATNLVDDVLIGNAYASEEELEALDNIDTTCITIRVTPAEGATEVELDDLRRPDHAQRTDASDWLIRSSRPRFDYRETSIPARPVPGGRVRRGDVLVVNDNLVHYRGEVEVALRDFDDDGTRNVVGTIPADEQFLLDYVLPDYRFGFIVG